MTTRPHVLIISLDGASWNVLRPLMEGGHLPHLTALANRGASGVMQSTYPPLTPPAWTSFQTGVTPPRHGVWAFTELDDNGWPSSRVVSSATIRCETVWEYLSAHQHRVVLIDVPLTYPFRAISGYLVSDIFIPYNTTKEHPWTQPAELGAEMDRQVGGWQFMKGPEMRGRLDEAAATRFLDLMQEFVRQREAAALYLLAQPDWDVAMVHFQAVDVFQHALWGWLVPDHPLFHPDRYAQAIAFYKRIDIAIGRMVAIVPSDTLVLVLSDHGFRSHRKVFNLNAWLHQQGWLKIPRFQAVRRAVAGSPILTQGVHWLKRLHVPKASLLLGYRPSFRMVDRRRSQAISTAGPWQTQYGLISLRRDGDPGRRARLRKAITQALLALGDPETGEQVVAAVHTVAELYGEPIGENSPDLIVVPADGYSVDPGLPDDPLWRPVTAESSHIGTHAFEGVWFLAGPGIAPTNGRVVSIVDFAPTLLFYLDLPVPRYMEGRVRTDLFTAEFAATRRLRFSDDEGVSLHDESYSAAEQAIVEERLRSLGYL